MVVARVDEQDVDRFALERLRALEPAEAAADHDDLATARCRAVARDAVGRHRHGSTVPAAAEI